MSSNKYNMREFMNLSEAWITTIGANAWHGDIDVFLNPSRQELREQLAASKWGILRGIVLPDVLYVFAAEIIHGVAADFLGIDQDIIGRIMIDKDGPFINKDDDYARVGQPNGPQNLWTIQQREQIDRYCDNHPILNRLFPNYVLGIR